MSININKNDSENSEKEINSQRKRAILLAVLMPCFFLAFGVLIYFGWIVSLKWAMETDATVKNSLGLMGLGLIVIEMVLALLFIRFVRWALKNIRPRYPQK